MIICRTHLTTQLFHSQPPNPCPQNSYPSPLLNRSPFQKKRDEQEGEKQGAHVISRKRRYIVIEDKVEAGGGQSVIG